ncbi:MAG: hypothetical protein WC756_03750 [Taibaiella sp.]|jgi:hypothetical protein
MPHTASKTFVQRAPNFFKANSTVKKATGFNVSDMQSQIGFVSKGGNDKSVDDLEQQEEGGSLKRSIVALSRARTSNSPKKKVKAKMRIADIKGHVVDPGEAGPKNNRNSKQAFVKSAVHAGKGGLIRGSGKDRDIIFEVRSLKRKGGNMMVKSVPVFSVKKGRDVRIKKTSFMERASKESLKKMAGFYNEAARAQINRLR